MVRSRKDSLLHGIAYALLAVTLFMVMLGGVVTTKGVGMAVPDWPTTYGDHLFLFPPSKWIAGVFHEHSHRLWGYLVGALSTIVGIWLWIRGTSGKTRKRGLIVMIAMAAAMGVHFPKVLIGIGILAFLMLLWAAWRALRSENRSPWLGLILLCAVIVQGVFGGLRVLLDSHGWGTEFGILHAALGQLFVLLAGSAVLVTSHFWSAATSAARGAILPRLVLVTTILVFVQILLGAVMRQQHAGLAVTTFPLAYGKLWPATDAASVALYNQQRLEVQGEEPITAAHVVVHMLHRYTGVAVAAMVIVCIVIMFRRSSPQSPLRKLGWAWLVLVATQVTLGILAITTNRKVDVTTAHVAIGALTFLTGWLSFLVSSRSGVELEATASDELISTKGAELKHA